MMDSHPKLAAAPEIFWLQAKNPREVLEKKYKEIVKPGQIYVGKEPRIITEEGLDKLVEVFGDKFQLIHIMRNPYDVLISYAKTKTEHNFEVLAPDFIRGYKKLMKLDWDWITIVYEALLYNPERTLKILCKRIGIEYSEDMLKHHKFKHETVDHYSDKQAVKKRFTDSINQFERFREENSYRPKPAHMKLCHELADLLGYRRVE
jgi:hypothetical protein